MNIVSTIKTLISKVNNQEDKVDTIQKNINSLSASSQEHDEKINSFSNAIFENISDIVKNKSSIANIEYLLNKETPIHSILNSDTVSINTVNFITTPLTKFSIYGNCQRDPSTLEYLFCGELNNETNKYEIPIEVSDNQGNTKKYIYSLNNPLRCIRTVKDEINVVNKKIIYNIGKIVLNGTEDWTLSTTETGRTNTIVFNTNIFSTIAKKPPTDNPTLIYELPEMLSSSVSIQSLSILKQNDLEIMSYDTKGVFKYSALKSKLSAQTVEGFKTWLQSNNITIWYAKLKSTEYDFKCDNIELPPKAKIELKSSKIIPSIDIYYNGSILTALESLDNKPVNISINGIQLSGNKSSHDLMLLGQSDISTSIDQTSTDDIVPSSKAVYDSLWEDKQRTVTDVPEHYELASAQDGSIGLKIVEDDYIGNTENTVKISVVNSNKLSDDSHVYAVNEYVILVEAVTHIETYKEEIYARTENIPDSSVLMTIEELDNMFGDINVNILNEGGW